MILLDDEAEPMELFSALEACFQADYLDAEGEVFVVQGGGDVSDLAFEQYRPFVGHRRELQSDKLSGLEIRVLVLGDEDLHAAGRDINQLPLPVVFEGYFGRVVGVSSVPEEDSYVQAGGHGYAEEVSSLQPFHSVGQSKDDFSATGGVYGRFESGYDRLEDELVVSEFEGYTDRLVYLDVDWVVPLLWCDFYIKICGIKVFENYLGHVPFAF